CIPSRTFELSGRSFVNRVRSANSPRLFERASPIRALRAKGADSWGYERFWTPAANSCIKSRRLLKEHSDHAKFRRNLAARGRQEGGLHRLERQGVGHARALLHRDALLR